MSCTSTLQGRLVALKNQGTCTIKFFTTGINSALYQAGEVVKENSQARLGIPKESKNLYYQTFFTIVINSALY